MVPLRSTRSQSVPNGRSLVTCFDTESWWCYITGQFPRRSPTMVSFLLSECTGCHCMSLLWFTNLFDWLGFGWQAADATFLLVLFRDCWPNWFLRAFEGSQKGAFLFGAKWCGFGMGDGLIRWNLVIGLFTVLKLIGWSSLLSQFAAIANQIYNLAIE